MSAPITSDMAFFIGLSILWLFVWTETAAAGYYFHRNQYHQIFSQRRPQLLQLFIGLILLDLTIQEPLAAATLLKLPVKHLDWIALSARAFIFYPLCYLSLLVLTQMFYDLQLAHEVLNQSWVVLLNPNAHDNNWFVVHRGSFGNWKWCGKRLAIWAMIWSIDALVCKAITFFPPDSSRIILAIGLSLAVLPIIFMPRYVSTLIADSWGIHNQFKFAFAIVVSVVGLETFFCVLAFFYLFPRDIEILPWIQNALVLVVLALIVFVLYFYPVYFYNTYIVGAPDSKRQIRIAVGQRSDSGELTLTSRGSGEELWRILEDPTLFQKFMDHVLRELSYESFLFVIELSQFKRFMRRHCSILSPKNPNSRIELRNIDKVPMSSLIPENVVEENDVYVVAKDLFKKYVDRKATMEINISWDERSRLYEIFRQHGVPLGEVRNDSQLPPLIEQYSETFRGLRTMNIPRQGSAEYSATETSNLEVWKERIEARISVEELFHVFDAAGEQVARFVEDSLLRFSD